MGVEQMTKEEVRRWSDKFHQSIGEDLNEVEEKLPGILQGQGYINKEQLEVVFHWKQDGQKGWKRRDLNRLEKVNDEYIRNVSKAAFSLEMEDSGEEAKTMINTLESIPGVGAAKATVILAFYDPERYAVADRILVEALLEDDGGFRRSLYPKLLDILRDLNPGGLDLRTVEKAYWHRYRVENDLL